jgi:hypothetical protein
MKLFGPLFNVRPWVATCVGAVALVSASAWAQQPRSGIYSCTINGKKLTSDRPIAECASIEQRELTATGTTRRIVKPIPTAEEQAEMEAQRKRDAEAKAAADDAKRRDRALLTRYPNKAAHDKERLAALEQLDVQIEDAERRIRELTEDRKKLDGEMEFYQKDPSKAPASLRNRVEVNTQTTDAQRRFIIEKRKEQIGTDRRFDEELVRLRVLWANAGVVVPSGRTTAPAANRATPFGASRASSAPK